MKYFLDEFIGKRNKKFLLPSLNATKRQPYPSESNEEWIDNDKLTERCNLIEKLIDDKAMKFIKEEIEKEKTEPDYRSLYLPSEGRQPFTRWRWSFPKSTELKVKAKTVYIQYEKELSSLDKMILKSFQKKYLYHAIDDILGLLKSKPIERENLLTILYSPVLYLQNHFSIDFFDIWIDEISITKASKVNKFLTTKNSNYEPFRYITIRLMYTNKRLPKKTESFW